MRITFNNSNYPPTFYGIGVGNLIGLMGRRNKLKEKDELFLIPLQEVNFLVLNSFFKIDKFFIVFSILYLELI